jgi:SAM-dependent methyltransferase
MIKDQMEKIYREIPAENIPWNLEAPPDILRSLVEQNVVQPCKALELGCGTGNYVIYLAKMAFDATGLDISDAAIEIAQASARNAGAECNFLVADALSDLSRVGNDFDFVYDWELLHHIFPEDRDRYLQNVRKLLKPGGRHLSVCFSEESGQFGGGGKYRRTPLGTVLYFSGEAEIRSLFERYLLVEELGTVDIKGKHTDHRAVRVLSRKRGG